MAARAKPQPSAELPAFLGRQPAGAAACCSSRRVAKRFGGLAAVAGVDLEVRRAACRR